MTASSLKAERDRFGFGRNWRSFLGVLDEERIAIAEASLRDMLGLESLAGRRFLDVGSGSGLFSLAARRLGASVHSFDYDAASVECTELVRQRFFPGDALWRVEQGSVLDRAYVEGIGRFDVVYAWGVLHHTGAMWQALGNVADLVADEGLLFVAIYNDQGALSRYWLAVKRLYNRLPRILRPAYALAVVAPRELRKLLRALVTLDPRRYLDDWRKVKDRRGMSKWHNILDWVGGYPFEVAKPEAIFAFYRDRGFMLVNLRTAKRSGCNEFVFRRL